MYLFYIIQLLVCSSIVASALNKELIREFPFQKKLTPTSETMKFQGSESTWFSDSEQENLPLVRGLFTNDVGLSVSNIEHETGAVLVKSRLFDNRLRKYKKSLEPDETDNSKQGNNGKSSRSRKDNDVTPGKLLRTVKGNEDSEGSLIEGTQIFLTFVEPAATATMKLKDPKHTSVLKAIVGNSGFSLEYLLSVEPTIVTSDTNSETIEPLKSSMDSLKSVTRTKRIPGSVQTKNTKTRTQLTNEDIEEIFDERVKSKLIVVRGQPPPDRDPDVIHLSQTLESQILVTPISVITQRTVSTVSTVTATSTITVTSTTMISLSQVSSNEGDIMPTMMNWPTRHALLSRTTQILSTTRTPPIHPTKSTDIRSPSTKTLSAVDILGNGDADFILTLRNVIEDAYDIEAANETVSNMDLASEVLHNITNLLNIKVLRNNTESLLDNDQLMTQLENDSFDISSESLTEALINLNNVTKTLQSLITKLLKLDDKINHLNSETGTSLLENRNVPTNLKKSKDEKMKNIITPSSADPFYCRRSGIKYPISIEYDELRERMDSGALLLIDVRNTSELENTGRMPWSYNLPLSDLADAFRLGSRAFQNKYGFPKPRGNNEKVVLTSRPGTDVVAAWNILQKFGYCNLKLYYGSHEDWIENGGSLLPYYGRFDQPGEDQGKKKSKSERRPPGIPTSETEPQSGDDEDVLLILTNEDIPSDFEVLLGATSKTAASAKLQKNEVLAVKKSSAESESAKNNTYRKTNGHQQRESLFVSPIKEHDIKTKADKFRESTDKESKSMRFKNLESGPSLKRNIDQIIIEEPAEKPNIVEKN